MAYPRSASNPLVVGCHTQTGGHRDWQRSSPEGEIGRIRPESAGAHERCPFQTAVLYSDLSMQSPSSGLRDGWVGVVGAGSDLHRTSMEKWSPPRVVSVQRL